MVRGRRPDTNHAEIRDGLRDCGYSVHDTSQCPGMLDLIVGAHGVLFWVEIKAGPRAKFTPREKDVFDRFSGYPVLRVHSVEDFIEQAKRWLNRGV